MNCPKCSVPVEDGLLTCPVCGEQIAANAQKEKISAAYETTRAIIKKRLKAPVFLATAIIMTIMLVMMIATMGSTLGVGAVLLLVPAIFVAIAMVTGYSLYSQKKANINFKKSIKRFSLFESCTKVMYKIVAIAAMVAGIAGAVYMIALPFMSWFADQTPGHESIAFLFENPAVYGLDTTMGIIILVAAAVVATVFLLFKAVHDRRRRAFVSIAKLS